MNAKWKEVIRQRPAIVLAMFVVVAALFSLYFGSIRFARGEWDQVPFETMVAGKGLTPFQYRVLVPWVVRGAELTVLPLPGIATGRKLAFLIEVGTLFALLLAFRWYLAAVLEKSRAASLLAFLMLLVLPFNYSISGMWTFWLWYDMPAVLFFTLGLLALYRKQWWIYYILFVVGTLNRETTCFLTIIYVFVNAGRERWVTLGCHVAAQFVIWMGIKMWLVALYAGNPGAGLSLNNFASNIHVLLSQPRLALIPFSSVGYLWIPAICLYPFIKDGFVRRACWVVPLFIVVMLISGNAPEVRIYGEMIPVLLPAYILIVRDFLCRDEGEGLKAEG